MKPVCVTFAMVLLACAAAARAQAGNGDESLVSKGEALYRAYCQTCHGRDAATPNPDVKDVRAFAGDEKAFAAVVKNGQKAMPAHTYLSEADIAALYAYVKSK
jgi:mono/diheme cytochrome c family protein